MSLLKRDAVRDAYAEFGARFNWPAHAKNLEDKRKIIDFDYCELKKMFSEETFPSALAVAKAQARKFPCIADFYRGFDPPAIAKDQAVKKYPPHIIYKDWYNNAPSFRQWHGISIKNYTDLIRIDIADLSDHEFGEKYKAKKSIALELVNIYGDVWSEKN